MHNIRRRAECGDINNISKKNYLIWKTRKIKNKYKYFSYPERIDQRELEMKDINLLDNNNLGKVQKQGEQNPNKPIGTVQRKNGRQIK